VYGLPAAVADPEIFVESMLEQAVLAAVVLVVLLMVEMLQAVLLTQAGAAAALLLEIHKVIVEQVAQVLLLFVIQIRMLLQHIILAQHILTQVDIEFTHTLQVAVYHGVRAYC